jgi:hypothetical protein
VSLGKAAKRCAIALDTSFRWRHRFLKAAQGVKSNAAKGIVEKLSIASRLSVSEAVPVKPVEAAP